MVLFLFLSFSFFPFFLSFSFFFRANEREEVLKAGGHRNAVEGKKEEISTEEFSSSEMQEKERKKEKDCVMTRRAEEEKERKRKREKERKKKRERSITFLTVRL